MSETQLVMKLDVVILCGGRGTRLGNLTQDTPKPLLEIGGKPFLWYLLRRFQQEGFENFFLAVNYLAHQFEDFAQRYRHQFPAITLVYEKEARGTGGALHNAAPHVATDPFVALNGDVFVNQPLAPVLEYHFAQKNVFTMIAVQTKNVDGMVKNKGGLELSSQDEIVRFRGHQQVEEPWVNAGVYVIQKQKVLTWPEGRYDLETEFASLMKPDRAKAFRSEAKMLDIGTPECLRLAKENYETYSLPPR